jgi:hypothetical protein
VVDQEGGTFELGNAPDAPDGDLYAPADPALCEAKRRGRDSQSCPRLGVGASRGVSVW